MGCIRIIIVYWHTKATQEVKTLGESQSFAELDLIRMVHRLRVAI